MVNKRDKQCAEDKKAKAKVKGKQWPPTAARGSEAEANVKPHLKVETTSHIQNQTQISCGVKWQAVMRTTVQHVDSAMVTPFGMVDVTNDSASD